MPSGEFVLKTYNFIKFKVIFFNEISIKPEKLLKMINLKIFKIVQICIVATYFEVWVQSYLELVC